MEKHASVSLCMIVKDEEDNLSACLRSVCDLVDEMIVVDTGSTDRTRELAGRLGARVIDFPWCDDFSAARNESLSHASGAWILWLDADERLDEQDRERLRGLLREVREEDVAYAMKQRSPGPLAGESPAIDVQVRLFRNRPELRWQYRVYERILPALQRCESGVRQTEITIQHLGYQDPHKLHGKLERNLRLLRLENAEHPDDAFTLFHLGMLYRNFGHAREALEFWRRSLELCDSTAPFLARLFAALTQAHKDLGQRVEAQATVRTGLTHFPEDAGLLLLEGLLLAEAGEFTEAEARLQRSLWFQGMAELGGVQIEGGSYVTRHYLAGVYCTQSRLAEAEAEWRKVIAEKPGFAAAWRGLGELCAARKRWEELARVVAQMEPNPQTRLDALVLRAEGHLGRAEFAAARKVLQPVIRTAPQALWPREVLSRVLLQEGSDWQAAEGALRSLLALAPDHAEARQSLSMLLEQRTSGRRSNAPPGPSGRFVSGNWRQFKSDPLAFLTHCARAYGDVVSLRFGRERILVLNHPQHIEQVLLANNKNFTKTFTSHYHAILGRGLFMSDGDLWRRQRRSAQPAFQRQRLTSHAQTIVASAERMLATWKDGETRDLHHEMLELTLELMARTTLGIDHAEQAHEFGRTFATALDCIESGAGRLGWLTGWLPTTKSLRLKRAMRRVHGALNLLITRRRMSGAVQPDFLSCLVDSGLEAGAVHMTDQQIRDECLNVFLAGRETTALALSWSAYLLAQDPVAIAELEAELDAVLGGRAPTAADIPQLRYTEWVIMEAMRLFPPAYALKRRVIRDCAIGDYFVRAGTTLILPQWVLHRDRRFWDDPDEFQPSRWAGGLAERLPHFVYFPFGGGPRLCIGNALAMMSAVLVLSTIAQKFRLALAGGHVVGLAPVATLRPVRGIRVVLTARRPCAKSNALPPAARYQKALMETV